MFDIHCHLHEAIFDADREEVISRAVDNGISRFVTNSGSIDDLAAVRKLAETDSRIIPCFGIHPWFTQDLPGNWLDQINDCLTEVPSGVGEIGLDLWRKNIGPIEEQTNVFREQLAIARALNRPAMIHCLKAYDQLLEVLKNDGAPDAGFLLHAYSGAWTMIEPLVKLGAYFSFSHATLAPDRRKVHKTIASVPTERFLIESDSPDLVGPEPYRPFSIRMESGRFRQEPANISAALPAFADFRGETAEILREQIKTNTQTFLQTIL